MNKVSIVIPCYNVRKIKLDRMLSSICRQDYKNIDVILVDDGSTDNTYENLKDWKTKIDECGYTCYLVKKSNGGVTNAINFGIPYCRGEYVCFLDSDDELRYNYVSRMAIFLDTHVQYSWVRCDAEMANEADINKILGTTRLRDDFDETRVFEEYLANRITHVAWLYMVRFSYFKKCFSSLKLYEPSFDQDWPISIPLAFNGCFGRIDEVLYKHILYEDSYSVSNTKDAQSIVNYMSQRQNCLIEILKQLPVDENKYEYHYDLCELAHWIQVRRSAEIDVEIYANKLSMLYKKRKNKAIPSDQCNKRLVFIFFANQLLNELFLQNY